MNISIFPSLIIPEQEMAGDIMNIGQHGSQTIRCCGNSTIIIENNRKTEIQAMRQKVINFLHIHPKIGYNGRSGRPKEFLLYPQKHHFL